MHALTNYVIITLCIFLFYANFVYMDAIMLMSRIRKGKIRKFSGVAAYLVRNYIDIRYFYFPRSLLAFLGYPYYVILYGIFRKIEYEYRLIPDDLVDNGNVIGALLDEGFAFTNILRLREKSWGVFCKEPK